MSPQVPCRLLAQLLLFLSVAHFDIDIVDMSIYVVEPYDSETQFTLSIPRNIMVTRMVELRTLPLFFFLLPEPMVPAVEPLSKLVEE